VSLPATKSASETGASTPTAAAPCQLPADPLPIGFVESQALVVKRAQQPAAYQAHGEPDRGEQRQDQADTGALAHAALADLLDLDLALLVQDQDADSVVVRCPAGFGHAELVVDRFIFGAGFSGGTGSSSGARFADGEVDRGYPVPARAASWSGRAIEGGEIPDRWLSSGQLAALGVPESVMPARSGRFVSAAGR
jgi:hypothetical protein